MNRYRQPLLQPVTGESGSSYLNFKVEADLVPGHMSL